MSTPRIGNLQQGRTPRCWCNGYACWAGEQGRQRLLCLVKFHGLNVDVSWMTSEWWETNITGKFSRLLVVCNVCKYHCNSTIDSFQCGYAFGCFCNGHVPWKSRTGRAQFVQIAVDRNLRIDLSGNTEEWWQENIKDAQSNIIAPCLDCGFITSSMLSHIVNGEHRPGCWCTGGTALWKTEDGWKRMQHVLEELGLDGSKMTWEWWKENIVNANSKLLIICKICDKECTNTSISNLRHGVGCSCRWKTQKKVHTWLQTFSTVQCEKGGCINPDTGYTMPFDFFITTDILKVCIELDGDHHFGWNSFMRKWCKLAAEHDLIKEKWMISQGFSLIRLYQPDVLYDKMDWKGFVNFCMDDIKRGATPRVYTPDIKQYREGLYTELRSLASDITA
jgi:hypothetical protein